MVKRGLKTKIENGWYPGVAPMGYLNHTDKLTGENTLITDPERFPLLRRMWDLMLTGLYTPPKILDLANKQWGFRTRPTRKMGGKPLCHSAIYQLFTKPFYYGWFEYPSKSGQWYQGKHEPMITEAEFDRVQAFLGRNGNPRPQSHFDFAFTGLIRCGECNRMVTAEEKHQVLCGNCRFKFAYRQRSACPRCQTPIEKMENPLFLHYTYYHCSKSHRPVCPQKSVNGVDLEKQISEYLARIQISKQFKMWAIKYLHELHAQESASQGAIIESQQKAYRECLQRIDNLVGLKTSPENADGSQLSNEEYGQRRATLLKEKASLEELLQDAGRQVEQQLRLTEETFEFACTAQDRFAKGNTKIKKEILLTIGSNLTLKDKKLSIEARQPFFILEESMSDKDPENKPIEPENADQPQGSNGASVTVNPSVLGGAESNAEMFGAPKPSFLLDSELHIPTFLVELKSDLLNLLIRKFWWKSAQVFGQRSFRHRSHGVIQGVGRWFNIPARQRQHGVDPNLHSSGFRKEFGQRLGVAFGLLHILTVRPPRELKRRAIVLHHMVLFSRRCCPFTPRFGFNREHASRTDDDMVNIPILAPRKIVKGAVA